MKMNDVWKTDFGMNNYDTPWSFYLAHPWESRDTTRKKELEIESRINAELLNPFYDVKREEVHLVDTGAQDRYHADANQVVERDLANMNRCDGFVGVIDGAFSIGTIMEIVYANTYNIPVILLVTSGCEKHYWLRYHAARIVTTWEELERELREICGDKVCNDKAREGEGEAGVGPATASGSSRPSILRGDDKERQEDNQADEHKEREEVDANR